MFLTGAFFVFLTPEWLIKHTHTKKNDCKLDCILNLLRQHTRRSTNKYNLSVLELPVHISHFNHKTYCKCILFCARDHIASFWDIYVRLWSLTTPLRLIYSVLYIQHTPLYIHVYMNSMWVYMFFKYISTSFKLITRLRSTPHVPNIPSNVDIHNKYIYSADSFIGESFPIG